MTSWGEKYFESTTKIYNSRASIIETSIVRNNVGFEVTRVCPLHYDQFPTLFDNLEKVTQVYEQETGRKFKEIPIVLADFKQPPKYTPLPNAFTFVGSYIGFAEDYLNHFKKDENHPGVDLSGHEVGHDAAEKLLPHYLFKNSFNIEKISDLLGSKAASSVEHFLQSLLATSAYSRGISQEKFLSDFREHETQTHPSYIERKQAVQWVDKHNHSIASYIKVMDENHR